MNNSPEMDIWRSSARNIKSDQQISRNGPVSIALGPLGDLSRAPLDDGVGPRRQLEPRALAARSRLRQGIRMHLARGLEAVAGLEVIAGEDERRSHFARDPVLPDDLDFTRFLQIAIEEKERSLTGLRGNSPRGVDVRHGWHIRHVVG